MAQKSGRCDLRVNKYTPLAWPVPGVVGIGRRAIRADRVSRGIVGVEPVVAVSAQAAKLAEPERGVVASVRRDVISDGRRRDAAIFQAKPTQWLDHELMRSAALPASGAVPAMNFRTMRHARQMANQPA